MCGEERAKADRETGEGLFAHTFTSKLPEASHAGGAVAGGMDAPAPSGAAAPGMRRSERLSRSERTARAVMYGVCHCVAHMRSSSHCPVPSLNRSFHVRHASEVNQTPRPITAPVA